MFSMQAHALTDKPLQILHYSNCPYDDAEISLRTALQLLQHCEAPAEDEGEHDWAIVG